MAKNVGRRVHWSGLNMVRGSLLSSRMVRPYSDMRRNDSAALRVQHSVFCSLAALETSKYSTIVARVPVVLVLSILAATYHKKARHSITNGRVTHETVPRLSPRHTNRSDVLYLKRPHNSLHFQVDRIQFKPWNLTPMGSDRDWRCVQI